jgi:hypothetical protein
VWALNDCEYYLQLASGVEWVEAEAPKSSRTVTIGVSTWRLNNCHGWSQIPNQVTMTFVDVKLQHHGSSLICTLDQILARPLAMAWPLSIKVTMFYHWAFVLLITITSSLNLYSTLQDVPGEQLGNDLQNCCSQVSSSVPDCTACKQVWAKQLKTSSPFLCKYHFLHLTNAFCNTNSRPMKGILREGNNDAAVQFFIKLDCFQHAIFGNQDFM